MRVEKFVSLLNSDFYTGVPDSQLKPLCNYLIKTYGVDSKHHIIAANEGNCVGLAAGYYLATGKVPVVYMQNSGEGNIINPLASLLNEKVYAIPAIFVIGWRGEPGVHDEPQHIYQGEITLKLLDVMGIKKYVVDSNTTETELKNVISDFRKNLDNGTSVAFVIKKGAFIYEEKVDYTNNNAMLREDIIKHIVSISGNDPIVSTTGKASRELFEIRSTRRQSHEFDFLTVGSMGHTSSIALGIALNKRNKKIWCIDGDGAVVMHMGALAVIGANCPNNMIHIVINNGAHETVGGMPSAAKSIDLTAIAKACGYVNVYSVENYDELDKALMEAKIKNELTFIEAKAALGAREDLGRPTTTTIENKQNFMEFLMK